MADPLRPSRWTLPRGLLRLTETLLWDGNPVYHSTRVILVITLAIVLFVESRLPNFPEGQGIGLTVVSAAVIILNLPVIAKYGGYTIHKTTKALTTH